MKGKGIGKEEPVFILTFSNDYGLAFVQNAMHRDGGQLQDHRLFRLDPKAQELFQAVRWRERQVVILNTEQISKICGFIWPPKDLKDRIRRIRKHVRTGKEEKRSLGYFTLPSERLDR